MCSPEGAEKDLSPLTFQRYVNLDAQEQGQDLLKAKINLVRLRPVALPDPPSEEFVIR